MIQSVLYGSPYSGCRKFSGWRPDPCLRAPVGTTWPPTYNSPGARMCVDRVCRPSPTIQALQQTHFRPTAPYPGKVLGPGTESLKPMPPLVTRFVGKPPYDLGRGIRGPSTTGPFTVFDHATWGYDEFGVTGVGAGGHNLGL